MSELHLAEGADLPSKKPGVLRLYSMKFCPFVARTRLVLEHKNIPYETVNVNLKRKPAWLWEKNALGLVPILELDDKIVFESDVTCQWLEDVYPEPRLTPSDPYRKAQDRMLFSYFSKVVSILIYAKMLKEYTDEEKHEEADKFLQHMKVYENALVSRGDGPFFGGKTPCMLDFLIWPHMERTPAHSEMRGMPELDVTTGRFPRILCWYQAMRELPAVKAIFSDTQTHMKFARSNISTNIDYDGI